jgi:hypothetical protein
MEEVIQQKRCFIIMPFGKSGTPEYSRNWKIYDLMIKPVVEACGYRPIRADELELVGNITRDIIELLHESDLVVADLSGHNANVFYELGVRHALYRAGTVPIIREGEILPFDIANYRAIFYSSELDGPGQFKRELKRRIKAFEKSQRKRSDNPVHDILGDRLVSPCLSDYISLKEHRKKIEEKDVQIQRLDKAIKSEINEKDSFKKRMGELQGEVDTLRAAKEPKDREKIITKRLRLAWLVILMLFVSILILVYAMWKHDSPRQQAGKEIDNLSTEEVKKMLKERDLFDTFYNKQGKGLNHQYEVAEKEGEKLVIDHTTGLTWQQSGSPNYMKYDKAKEYIKQLNDNRFAGHDDWRLPTLEEAMSLMEPEKKNGDLYISEVFDKTQSWIWTADKEGRSAAWVVYFDSGNCFTYHVDNSGYVRAVVR